MSAMVLALVFGLTACNRESALLQQHQFAVRNGTRTPSLIQDIGSLEHSVVWIHRITSPQEVICSGILMSNRVVLTAGHCIIEPENLAVSRVLSVDPQPHPVRSTLAHTTLDLAILSLHVDLPHTVQFPTPTTRIGQEWIGHTVEAAGFGEDFDLGTDVALRFAELAIVQLSEHTIVVDGFGERGLCFGDSGAPVFSINGQGETVLLAIASHGDTSCLHRDHLIRLASIGDWLYEQIERHNQSDEALCDDQMYPSPQCDGEVRIECRDNQLESIRCNATDRDCIETPEGSDCVAASELDASLENTERDGGRPIGDDDDGVVEDEILERSTSKGCQSANKSPYHVWLLMLLLICVTHGKRLYRLWLLLLSMACVTSDQTAQHRSGLQKSS
jgi:hypothetical protein